MNDALPISSFTYDGTEGNSGTAVFSCECDAAGISVRSRLVSAAYVGNQEKRKTENSGAASGAGICGCRKCVRGVAESLLPEYDWVKMSERPHEKGISG